LTPRAKGGVPLQPGTADAAVLVKHRRRPRADVDLMVFC
jgi:hypothetical protein